MVRQRLVEVVKGGWQRKTIARGSQKLLSSS